MAGIRLYQERPQVITPHTCNALTKLVISMVDVPKNARKATFFGRDKGEEACARLLQTQRMAINHKTCDAAGAIQRIRGVLKALIAAAALILATDCLARGGGGGGHYGGGGGHYGGGGGYYGGGGGHYGGGGGYYGWHGAPMSPNRSGYMSGHNNDRGYTRRDGPGTAPHDRPWGDHPQNNNWNTKGNDHNGTGKAGTSNMPEHTHDRDYTKHDGHDAAPHDRPWGDHPQNNNWNTKGNDHNGTGKAGTGYMPGHTHDRDYTKHDGTYVDSHDRPSEDHPQNNNWSAKGKDHIETDEVRTQHGDE